MTISRTEERQRGRGITGELNNNKYIYKPWCQNKTLFVWEKAKKDYLKYQ